MSKPLSENAVIVLICAGLAAATFIAFEEVRHNGFVNYDDTVYVTQNEHVRAGITRESVYWAFTSRHEGTGNWHPVTWLSHMLDCQLFDLESYWHHLTNLLFHIANAMLLFWIMRRMTGALWPSVFVAAVFALHPQRVESVAWLAERKDVLSGFFWLLTIAAYTRYTAGGGLWRYMAVVVSFALGLMAKPMLVTLPFVLLILDYWPLYRLRPDRKVLQKGPRSGESLQPGGQTPTLRFLLIEKIPLFILTAVSCVATFIIQRSHGAMVEGFHLPLNIRLINASVSYVQYIVKMFWPTGLAVLYPYNPGMIPAWQVAGAFLLLLFVTAGAIYASIRLKHRWFLAGWLWYIGTMVPVIGLVQVGSQSMADRYTYIPMVGVSIIIAWGAAQLSRKWPYYDIRLGIVGSILLLVLAVCTRFQVLHWRNDLALFGRAVAVTKNNCTMHKCYGVALLEAGRFDEAEVNLTESLRIKPDYADGHESLGLLYHKQERFDEAIASYQEALRLGKRVKAITFRLAEVYADDDRFELAIDNYLKVLELQPDSVDTRFKIGVLLFKQGKYDQAMDYFQYIVSERPGSGQTLYYIGQIRAWKGEFDRAIEDFDKAIDAGVRSADLCNNYAIALISQGKSDLAAVKWQEALLLKPEHADANRNMGLIMVQQQNYDEAIEYFSQALSGKEDFPQIYNDLGSVYLHTGEYDLAIANFRQAIKLKPDYSEATANLKKAIQRQDNTLSR
ncbi:MAG: tetratricopeptide repeat protein [Planctomycetes bacterium]|nr:tetratricopeptide repeat protein [Planctomycetota bacterium]